MGLANSPSVFQRCLNIVLRDLPFVKVYIDDILIFSRDIDEHLKHLDEVFRRLKAAELRIKLRKCEFVKKSVRRRRHFA